MGLAFESSSSASLLRTLLLLTSDKMVYVNQTGGLYALEQHGSDHVMQGTDAGGSRLHAFGQGSP
jgi:hypothetical protein